MLLYKKIVAHDFRYDPRNYSFLQCWISLTLNIINKTKRAIILEFHTESSAATQKHRVSRILKIVTQHITFL